MTTDNQNTQLTDGFHLVIDALKANDLNTIFGLVGIPITDLCRLAQAEGMRFIGFRHEQHAGNAAAILSYSLMSLSNGAGASGFSCFFSSC
mgnify:CR=1 FL=1